MRHGQPPCVIPAKKQSPLFAQELDERLGKEVRREDVRDVVLPFQDRDASRGEFHRHGLRIVP